MITLITRVVVDDHLRAEYDPQVDLGCTPEFSDHASSGFVIRDAASS